MTFVRFGSLLFLACAFVSAASSAPRQTRADAPVFSRQPGFYDAPISVSLTAGAPGAIITYTLDGSEPTLDSTVFTAPILLGDPSGNPNTISLIPTNFRTNHHFAWRPPRGPVCKLNLIRARAFVTGQEPSPVATGSFVVSADLAGQFPLPVVSVATAAENFFADDLGIYVPGDTYIPGDLWSGNYFQEGDDWERPVHIELFDGQGHLLLAQDAGARSTVTTRGTIPRRPCASMPVRSMAPRAFNAPCSTTCLTTRTSVS